MKVAEPQPPRITDSIPRAGIQQVIDGLAAIDAAGGKSTFDQIRQTLHRSSARRAPASREAMWTVARDVLSELQKLGLAVVGVLPRKRSEVERLSQTPCELTDAGHQLTKLAATSGGRAFDQLLLTWMNEHPYFRLFMVRLLTGPLYVPDITTLRQIGGPGADGSLSDRVIEDCRKRLSAVLYPTDRQEEFDAAVRARVAHVQRHSSLGELDAKRWVDLIEDFVVIPAFLAAEKLPFDAVTFQQLIRVSQEFFSAAWTSSHPDFEGRTIFATCHFQPPSVADAGRIESVVHHGRNYATDAFPMSLKDAYKRLAKGAGGYVNAYAIRALVCVQVGIQPVVFAHCLDERVKAGDASGMTIFTELPFTPPPWGEQYVEIGTRRIGLIKIADKVEEPRGA